MNFKRNCLIGLFAFAACLGLAQSGLGQDDEAAEEEIGPPKVASERIEDSPLKPLSAIRFEATSSPAMQNRVPPTQLLPANNPQPVARAGRNVQWHASNLRYNRPYFEEMLLERHGLTSRPLMQPTISAMRFYATASLLPVLRLVKPDWQCYDHRAFGNPGSPLCN